MVEDDDEVQLAFAASQKRAFVTFNHQDLAPLHKQYATQGKEHWGIILSTEENLGVLTHRLLRLLNTLSEEELKNQMRWLNEFK